MRTVFTAVSLCVLLTAAAPQNVPRDRADVPALAKQLLASGVPDAQTRIALDLAAGDADDARAALARLPDLDAYQVAARLTPGPNGAQADWETALEQVKGRPEMPFTDAVRLVTAYAEGLPATASALHDDANRRYLIRDRITVKTPDGAALSAVLVRKREGAARLPAALVFTIYADPAGDSLRAQYGAARGYAVVTAYTRGKAYSPDKIVPYEDDGRDADRVISWIARQPWSNGKVGMYGGSYNGFTQWAAAKYRNPALKTIVPYVANNPGNGLPMENNIFLFVNYPWTFYVTDNKFIDNAAYADPRLRTLNERWYKSGKSYRDIPKIDGRPNPWLQRWLDHPGYDAYWQAMVPYRSEFSKIDIPVLTVSGYYDDGQGSALNFLKDHSAYNKRAIDYLVIGPYDHFGSQRAHKDEVLRGYRIDPVAQFSTPQLTFDWLDWVLRGGKRPAMLANRINYEVMGANVWRHAASIPKMASGSLTLYLTNRKSGGQFYALSVRRPRTPGYLRERIDFADRKTVNNSDSYPFPITGAKPDFSRGYTFVSAPFKKSIEIDGFFTGRLQAIVNKRDMDYGATLYEMEPDGTLMHLSYFLGRASYGDGMNVRRLLAPGKVRTLSFDRSRLVCRRLKKGSRLLLTIDVNKNQFAQINYGTGRDVSSEDIRDAKVPLDVRWLSSSSITVPVSY